MEISLYRKLLESEEDRLGMATGFPKDILAKDILVARIFWFQKLPSMMFYRSCSSTS